MFHSNEFQKPDFQGDRLAALSLANAFGLWQFGNFARGFAHIERNVENVAVVAVTDGLENRVALENVQMGSQQVVECLAVGCFRDSLGVVAIKIKPFIHRRHRVAMLQQSGQRENVLEFHSLWESDLLKQFPTIDFIPGVGVLESLRFVPVGTHIAELLLLEKEPPLLAPFSNVFIDGIFDEIVFVVNSENVHQRLQRVAVDVVVAVDEGDVFALRPLDSGVSGSAQPLVRLMNRLDSMVALRQFVANLAAPVGRTVIDENELIIAEFLSQHALDTSLKRLFNVVCWYDDG